MSCDDHLEFLEDSLGKKEDWALNLFKSWFQFTSKPSLESLINFGPFKDCLNFKHNLNSSQFQGQYCLISYSSILYQNFDYTSIEYEMDSIIEKEMLILKNGICVPSSCSLTEIEIFLRNHLKETDIIVLSTYCQTKEYLSVSHLDCFVLFVFSIISLINLICTFYDVKWKGRKLNNRFTKAFSLHKNFKDLIDTDDNGKFIGSANGLKAMSAIWIIIGHRMDMMIENSSVIREFMSTEEKMILRISELFTSVVDTFFVISGLLVTVKCLRLFKENKFSFINHFTSRFFRFFPPLSVIVLFFMSSLPIYLSSGPQMFELKEEQDECRINWLRSLLLVGNFNGNFCLRHTWYTSTDFQLFIISPAIVYGLFKFKKNFLKVIAFMIVLGQINIFMRKYSEFEGEFYYEFYYRFTPWFIGIILGFILQNFITEHIIQNMNFFGMLATASVILMEFLRFRVKSKFSVAFFEATHRVFWSITVAWIIYLCHNKSNFLSHRIWTPVSKMCLSIYLVHYLVILLSYTNMQIPYQFKLLWLIRILLCDILFSLIFSFIFYMFIEAPVNRIVKSYEKRDYYLPIENR